MGVLFCQSPKVCVCSFVFYFNSWSRWLNLIDLWLCLDNLKLFCLTCLGDGHELGDAHKLGLVFL